MSAPNREALELLLQDASEHLQYLREYAGVLQEDVPEEETVRKLHDAAVALAEASRKYEFPLLSEIANKLAHVFQYARNAALSPETRGPLTEFLADGISVLEFDLIEIGSNGEELAGEIAAFKLRYAFAFPEAAAAQAASLPLRPGRTSQRRRARLFPQATRSSRHFPMTAKFPMRFSNSSCPRPKNTCKSSPILCSRSRPTPAPKKCTASFAPCTR